MLKLSIQELRHPFSFSLLQRTLILLIITSRVIQKLSDTKLRENRAMDVYRLLFIVPELLIMHFHVDQIHKLSYNFEGN